MSDETIWHNIISAKGNMQIIAREVRNGETIDDAEREQLRLVRAWCDELLAGGCDPAEVYLRTEKAA